MSNLNAFGDVSAAEALAAVAAGRAVIFDVRSRLEQTDGSLPGARLVPVESEEDLEALRVAVEAETVKTILMCHSGARSKYYQEYLAQNGLKCLNMLGGIAAAQAEK